MKTIKYLLVNETSNEKAARAIRDSKLPDIGFHHIVEAGGLSRGDRGQILFVSPFQTR